jgi:hypothetical protein
VRVSRTLLRVLVARSKSLVQCRRTDEEKSSRFFRTEVDFCNFTLLYSNMLASSHLSTSTSAKPLSSTLSQQRFSSRPLERELMKRSSRSMRAQRGALVRPVSLCTFLLLLRISPAELSGARRVLLLISNSFPPFSLLTSPNAAHQTLSKAAATL